MIFYKEEKKNSIEQPCMDTKIGCGSGLQLSDQEMESTTGGGRSMQGG